MNLRPVIVLFAGSFFLLLLVSCRKHQSDQGSTITKTNSLIFIDRLLEDSISEFGGRSRIALSSSSQSDTLLYPIQHDSNGVQFWISGDQVNQLFKMLTDVYGPPQLVQTNRDGRINVAYTPIQTGAAVSFASNSTKDEVYTHVIVTRPDSSWTNLLPKKSP
jgi:hypothetical protein